MRKSNFVPKLLHLKSKTYKNLIKLCLNSIFTKIVYKILIFRGEIFENVMFFYYLRMNMNIATVIGIILVLISTYSYFITIITDFCYFVKNFR